MLADDKSLLLAVFVLPIVAGVICWCLVVLRVPTRSQNHSRTLAVFENSSDTLGVLSIADAYDHERRVLW